MPAPQDALQNTAQDGYIRLILQKLDGVFSLIN
ncbi:hypothetical protein NIES4071_45320 [Calothrix sp. NIES-4071]|nr:hypothetical protein NIES4071_45320 [Calothrix sp. NIES-4071]BAZ58845.1 hypothetical protein NIES4105_45250 [Calothrix sp. NIES-4105]